MLWGFLALAIPIIIHLFNFRRTRRLVFSSTKFIKEVKVATNKRRTIKEWLVLLSRLFFISFVVLAFSEPYRKGESAEAGGEVLLFLDNSMSMEGEYANGIRKIDQAAILAQDIVNSYPDTYRFRVFTNENPYRPGLLQSAEQTLDQIAAIQSNYIPDRPFAFLTEFFQQAGSQARDVFIISDFQERPPEIPPTDSIHTVRFLAIESTETSNAFVDSLYLESPFLIQGAANALKIRIKNSGTQPSANLVVRFMLNGETQGSTTLQLAGGVTEEVSFPLPSEIDNNSEVIVELDDYPNIYDNEFYAVLTYSPRFKVVLVEDGNRNSYFSSVFGNEDLFELDVFPLGNIDYGKIGSADLVVLNQLKSLPPALSEGLNTRLAGGGTTLLIPSDNADMASYQRLQGMPLEALATVISPTSFSVPDAENPFFIDVFSELQDNIELPSAALAYTFRQQGQPIITLRNGMHFLMSTGNESSLISMASPLDDRFTNLGRHALFVPLMYKMASFKRENSDALYTRSDAALVRIPAPKENPDAILKMRNQDLEFIPDQRRSGSQLLVNFNDVALQPAFYSLETDQSSEGVLAVNAGKEESLQEFQNVEALRTVFEGIGNLEVFGSRELTTFAGQLAARFSGTPIWKIMLILAIGCLVAEILIIRLIR